MSKLPHFKFRLYVAEDGPHSVQAIANLHALCREHLAEPEVAEARPPRSGSIRRGKNEKLIPVRIEECQPPGLLGSIVYVDLVKLDINPLTVAT